MCRVNVALLIIGLALLVAGCLIAATDALAGLRFGPSHLVVVSAPWDAIPSVFHPAFLTWSLVVGAVLILVGAVLCAAWLGYFLGLRAKRT